MHQTGNSFDDGDPATGGNGGNYWSNWCPPDHPDTDPPDGIVDEPYVIKIHSPDDITQDNYPWTFPDGWSPPVNQPPVADAGPDQTVEQDSSAGASVTLDGSGSSDDGQIQPLTYTWTWPGGSSATGVNPTVTLPPGTTIVTLTVDDGQFSATDTVDITVEDTTPPDITCPGNTTIVSIGGVPVEDEQIQTFLASASAYDDCDPLPVITNDAPAVFTAGDTIVNFTATDVSGNSSSCSSTVTVVEPAEVIEQIVLDIELMNVPEKAEKEMGKAVKELNKAIDEFNNDRIDKALNNIAKAVKRLMKAEKKGADTQDVIDELVALVQGIAETAIEDAIGTVGPDDLHVVKAQEHYDKALGNLADGKYDKAIKEFKNAYREAMKALG